MPFNCFFTDIKLRSNLPSVVALCEKTDKLNFSRGKKTKINGFITSGRGEIIHDYLRCYLAKISASIINSTNSYA